MANKSQDVELRIRARDYSQKTLDEVVKSLKSLVDAQEEQFESARRGETSAQALEASYRKIEQAGKALLGQDALIRMYQTQAQTLDEVKNRVESARSALTEYRNSLAGTTDLTAKQNAELNKLARAVQTAERAQVQAESRVAKTTERLAKFGIESDNLAQSQDRIRSAVSMTNQALERQDAAISTLDKELKAYNETQKKSATYARSAAEFEEKRARNLRTHQEGEVNNLWQKLLAEREAKERQLAEAAAARAAAQKAADEAAARSAKEALELAHEQAIAEDKARAAAQKEVEARQAQRAALNKAADEADALAKGYTTLAHSIKNVRGDELSKQIRGITDPTGEAIKTTEGLAAALDGLEKKADAIKGPIQGYGDMVKELTAVQKSLHAVAGQVDAYQRQMDAVRAARTEFTQARNSVKQLADQMRSGKGDTAQLTSEMNKAQGALRTAAENMRRQTQTAHEMRNALREAGVSTRNLADAEAQLISQAQRATTVTDRLTKAFHEHGQAADNAHGKLKKFSMGERTTLSFFERLRGEVIAVTTAFVGVQAAIGLAQDSLAAFRSKQTIESRLGVMVGNDAKLIREEWDYLMGQAERLGFEFESAAMSYSKFGVAAKMAGLSGQDTRFVFEKLAEGALVAKMSAEDFDGVLKAVEQMLSKGAIQAEELRQQLGDRLPGAMGMAAKGAGVTVAEFTKMMETGAIGAEFVINLARQVGEEFGGGLDKARKNINAIENDFKNAMLNFRLAIAESGFVEAYTEFLQKLTEILKSTEGQQLAQSLANGFTAVIQVLQWCAENVDVLAAAFAALISLQLFRWLGRSVQSVRDMTIALLTLGTRLSSTTGLVAGAGAAVASMATAMGVGATGVAGLTRGIGLLTLALRTLLRFLPVIGAAFTAYEVYSALTANKDDAKKAGEELGEAFTQGTADSLNGGSRDKLFAATLDKTIAKMEERTVKADRRTRMKGAKKELDERLEIAGEEYEMLAQQAKAQISDQKILASTLERIEKGKNAALEVERKKFEQEQAAAAARGGGNRVNLAKQVADELAKIEDDLAKRETQQDPTASFEDRMRTRVAAVSHEYNKLGLRIDKLARTDKAAADAARARLADYVKQRQEIERVKVTQEEVNRLDKIINDQMSLRGTLIERANALYKAGVIPYEEMRDAISEANRDTAQEIRETADELLELAELAKDILRPEAYQAVRAKAETMRARNNPEGAGLQGTYDAADQRVNELLQQRDAILQGIQNRRELGLITERDMAREMDATNARFKDVILNSAQEALMALTALRDLGHINSAVYDTLLPKIQGVILEQQNLRATVTELSDTFTNSFLSNATNAVDGLAEAIGNLITKQQESSQAWADAGVAASLFFANLLRDLAMAIIRQQILNLLAGLSGGGGFFGSVGNSAVKLGGVAKKHAGGVIGRGTGTRTSRVSPFVFAGAERFHTGGLPGLRSDEVPAILQKGEEVLDRDNPRNILNGGAAAGAAQAMAQRFVLVDDRSKMAEAMAGAEGEQVTLLHLRRNIPTLKQWMK